MAVKAGIEIIKKIHLYIYYNMGTVPKKSIYSSDTIVSLWLITIKEEKMVIITRNNHVEVC